MTDREYLEAFESGTLAAAGFHHRDHVRMAFCYLRVYPPAEALARFSAALRRFAAAQGKPERYHETITWAYLLLVRDRMARREGRRTWEDFAAENPDLLSWRPGILQRYYREETLASDLAREVFVFPDRCEKRLGEGRAGRTSKSAKARPTTLSRRRAPSGAVRAGEP